MQVATTQSINQSIKINQIKTKQIKSDTCTYTCHNLGDNIRSGNTCAHIHSALQKSFLIQY